ncbi:MAG TPA: hypothetical protein VH413_14545 [Verrucomicrobiae bacterium]|nr:hypothetical protein [Verrucomicrobiae bacterium]
MNLAYDSRLRMYLAGLNLKAGLKLAVITVAACISLSALAGEHGEAIQFSDPDVTSAASNSTSSLSAALERMNPTPSGFRQVQENIFGPLKNGFRPDSMQGVLSLPLPPQTQPEPTDRRTREKMDRKRNWAFTDLSDLYPDTSEAGVEEALGVETYDTDSTSKRNLSVVEKYYENLNQKNVEKQNRLNTEMAILGTGQKDPFSGSSSGSFSPVTEAFPDGVNRPDADRDVFMPTLPGGGSEKNTSLFGVRNVSPKEVQTALQAQRNLEDFKRLLDPSLPAPKLPHIAGSGMELQDFTRPPSLSSSTGDTLYKEAMKDTGESHRSALYPTLGLIDPTTTALHSHVFDDPTATALGMPNPIKAVAAPKPAETIRQMLDPFGASVLKPKF